MSQLCKQTLLRCGFEGYRHYRNRLSYSVIGVALPAENSPSTRSVIYRGEYKDDRHNPFSLWWSRPLDMFTGVAEHGGARFEEQQCTDAELRILAGEQLALHQEHPLVNNISDVRLPLRFTNWKIVGVSRHTETDALEWVLYPPVERGCEFDSVPLLRTVPIRSTDT